MKHLKKMNKLEFSWREGAYLDPMSIVHFLAGSLAYYVLIFIFDLSLVLSVLITLTGAFLWELFEVFIGVTEKISNKIVDIILPISAFFLFHYFVPSGQEQLVFSISMSAFVILWFVGAYYYFRHKEGM